MGKVLCNSCINQLFFFFTKRFEECIQLTFCFITLGMELWIKSSSSERDEAERKLNAFFESLGEEEKELVNAAVAEDFAHVHKIIDESKELRERIEVRKQLEGVLPFISVSEFAKRYFGKSASWLHQRINGNAVHGKVATFTPTELTTLANALKDVAGKLTHAASAFV